MRTKPPAARELTAILLFALSCVGLTIYLWLTFGGSTPLQARQYRMVVPFADASGLTIQADVRIAGVNVGRVVAKRLDVKRHLTYATLELSADHAPRPRDTRAVLRQKTVLGETYIQLSAGTSGTPLLPDNGTIAPGQVSGTVHIDELLRTFDPDTRKALATWLQGQGAVLGDGGPALSAALAQLEPLGQYGGDTLQILRRQDRALAVLLRDGGTSLAALTARRGELRSLVADASRVVSVTASRDAKLADTIRALPPFLTETRRTVRRLNRFADTATPLVRQLQPAATALTPVLRDAGTLAPGLRTLLQAIGPLEHASRRGLPALSMALDDAVPLLKRLTPFLGTLEPAFAHLSTYRQDIIGFIANAASVTQPTLPAADGSGPLHYFRASVPINPESLAAYPARLPSSRSNPYPAAGTATEVRTGKTVAAGTGCGSGRMPGMDPGLPDGTKALIAGDYVTANPYGPACRTAPGTGFVTLQPLR